MYISDILIPNLQQRFADRGVRINSTPTPRVVFPAIHPDVGDIEIHDDEFELTVVAGKFTHAHFSNYDDAISKHERAVRIVDEVVVFLEDLFADRIVLWGSHEGSGGWHDAGEYSEFQKDSRGYVWSGPLSKSGGQKG